MVVEMMKDNTSEAMTVTLAYHSINTRECYRRRKKYRNSAKIPPNQVLMIFLSRASNSTGFTGVLSPKFL